MRPVDHLSRLWGVLLLRVPYRWRQAALAIVGGLALGSLIGAGLSGASIESQTSTSLASAPLETPCQQQTWPYLTTTCLQGPAERPREVRLLPSGRDAPATVYLYPETPKPKAATAKSKRTAASDKAKPNKRSQSPSNRDAAPQRSAPSPGSAYRAYGYAPR
jgi:hypothetical protein